MKIETIAEHSVDVDRLKRGSKILDLGCRGFLFADEMRRRCYEVYTVDVDPKIKNDDPYHHQIAIAGENGTCCVFYTSDPQATKIKKSNIPLDGFDVPMITLQEFSKKVDVKYWDVIKIDIEGTEYEVIMNMEKPIADQLSIEFHLHTGAYGELEMLLMEDKLTRLGYYPIQHEKTRMHGLSYNYWNSLFVLK